MKSNRSLHWTIIFCCPLLASCLAFSKIHAENLDEVLWSKIPESSCNNSNHAHLSLKEDKRLHAVWDALRNNHMNQGALPSLYQKWSSAESLLNSLHDPYSYLTKLEKSKKQDNRDQIPVFGLELPEKHRFIMRISIFDGNASELARKILEQFSRSNANILVIDLRSNLGGRNVVTNEILSNFVPRGKTTYTIEMTDEDLLYQFDITSFGYRTFYKNILWKKKFWIMILTDHYTASASEIFITSLKFYCNVVVVGQKTYGKNVYQEDFPISENEILTVNCGYWRTPGGYILQEGITPDVVMPAEATFEEYYSAGVKEIEKQQKYLKYDLP